MKNFTKISMIILLNFFYYQTNAQTFGIRGGLNLANMLDKDDDNTYSNDYGMNPGYHLGATINVPINDYLSFEPGLLFTTKGFKYKNEIMPVDITAKLNLYYLDIPLTLKASHDLGGIKIFVAAGPYLGIGLIGKIKTTNKDQGKKETTKEDIKWGAEENDNLRRLDMGLTFGGGVEISPILIGISYDLGLANIATHQQDGGTSKNRVLRFSVGYRFGK